MKSPREYRKEIEKLVQQKAGGLEAGDFKAGSPGLIKPTPEMRQHAIAWLTDRMSNADELFQNSLYVVQKANPRQIDWVILNQAAENRTIILWAAQCMGLVELCDEFQRIMTLDDDDKERVEHARNVTEAKTQR